MGVDWIYLSQERNRGFFSRNVGNRLKTRATTLFSNSTLFFAVGDSFSRPIVMNK